MRDRLCDVEPLCRKFLADHGVTSDNGIVKLFLPRLLAHNWPGNVRELVNISERIAHLVLTNHESAPEQLDLALGLGGTKKERSGLAFQLDIDRIPALKSKEENVEWQENDYMLKMHERKLPAVSERLDIGRTTLWRKYNRAYDTES